MGRYSPTVVPQVPDPLAVVDSMWSGYLGYKQGQRAEEGLDLEKRGLDIREKEAEASLRSQELSEYERGFRRGRAPNMVPDENLPAGLRRGTQVTGPEGQPPAIGLQPGERQGIPALRDRLSEAKARFNPQVVAKPGALVPGTNIFADRPVMAQELAPEPQYGGMVPDPRYEQVTEDTYFDPGGTREARMLDRQTSYEEFRRTLQEQYETEDHRKRVQALIAAGVDPDEAQVEAFNMDIPGRTTSGSRPWDAMTMNQAIQYVQREAIDYEYDELGNYTGQWSYKPGWDEDRVLETARRYARGVYDEPQPMDEGSQGGVVGGEFLDIPGIPFEEYAERYRYRFPGEPQETPAAEPQLTDEQIAEARELVSDLSPADARAELQDLGLTSADIERIIGG